MTRDITTQVIVRERAIRALDESGDAFDRLAGRSEAAGKRMSASAQALGGRLGEVRGELEDLQRRYAETGDSRYLREIAARTRQVSQITQILKDQLKDLGGDGRELKLGDLGIGAAGNALADLGAKQGAAIAAAIGAPIIPAIAGAASAGILLGIGGAGIAAGIAGAARSPEVQSAWKLLGEEGGRQLDQMGAAFVTPLTRSLTTLRREVDGLDLGGLVRPLAAEIEPLTDGIVGLAQRAMPGLRAATKAAAEPIDALASELPELGDAIGSMLEGVSRGAGGASRALEDLLTTVEVSVTGAGEILGALGKVYELADLAGATGILGQWDDVQEMIAGRTSKTVALNRDSAGSYRDVAQAAQEAAEAERQATQAANEYNSATKTIFDGNIALEQAYDDLADSIRDHGTTLDASTNAGRENLRLVESMIDTANRQAEAERQRAVAAGDGANADARAAAVRDAAIASIRQHAAELHLDQAAVEALIGALTALPRGTIELQYKIRVATELVNAAGLPAGAMSAGQIASAARVIGKGMSAGGPVGGGGPPGMDTQLRVLASDEYVVPGADVRAAGGPQALDAWRRSLRGGGSAPSAGGGASGGGGATTINLTVQALDPRGAADAVMDALQYWESRNGSGWRS